MERPKDIIIHKQNHSTVFVECREGIAQELRNFFSAFAPNYMWSPKYKAKIWDGKIRFFTYQNELPIGLVPKLYEFAEMGKYSIECKYKRFNDITREEFIKFVDSLDVVVYDADGNRTSIRPYQLECAYQCIIKKTLSVEAATSAGKSVIIYIIMRFMHYVGKKSIIVCSQAHLVEQMFTDFKSYGWDSERFCHRIYAGQKKYFDAPVMIVCWQSMVSTNVRKINPYENFDCLLVDEAHGAKAEGVKELAKICINAEYRYGFSGTYPDPSLADWYTIVGSLGPIQQFASYKFLQDNGYISKLKIYNVILNYDHKFKKKLYQEHINTDQKKRYALQNTIIQNNEQRNDFIVKMVQNLNENVLVLFSKKAEHGYVLKEIFEAKLKDKIVVYIDGDVPVHEREDIRKLIEQHSNVVLIGSYGCVSVGTNYKNLGSVIFASGYKSRIKTLQSIGRSLRLHKNKKYAKLFDIVDNCSFKMKDPNDPQKKKYITFVNYSMDHYKERASYYKTEQWDVKSIQYNLDN